MANNTKELSIQITLSGFSFSINTLDVVRGGCVASYNLDSVLNEECYLLDAEVQWSTPGVLIMPYELFNHSAVEAYLQSASLLNRVTQQPLFAVQGDYVAVWAVQSELYEYVEQRLPSAVNTHSLLKVIGLCDNRSGVVAIELDDSMTLHLAVGATSGISVARTLSVSSFEDVLFYALQFAPHGQGSRLIVSHSAKADELVDYLKDYFISVQSK